MAATMLGQERNAWQAKIDVASKVCMMILSWWQLIDGAFVAVGLLSFQH